MSLQEHIKEHDKPENEHIKSIYGEKLDGDGALPEYYNLRLNNCEIGKLTAPKENVIHFNKGSINDLQMTNGSIYLDGTKIQNITATDSRIRISDSIDGDRPEIVDLNLTRCEIDVLNSSFLGDQMFKSIKDCRINVISSVVNCRWGGKLDGRSFNLVKSDVFFTYRGWIFDNIHAQYTSNHIVLTNDIPLHVINSSYIGLSNNFIDSKDIHFIGSNYSACANDTKFLGGCRAFEVSGGGNIKIENCILDNRICVKLTGSACSCLWHGGSGNALEIGVDLEDNASVCLVGLEFLKGGQIGISAKGKSWAYAEDVKLIKGGDYACLAEGFSSIEGLDCTYEGGVTFKGNEGTFVIRGDKTTISGGTTAQGSGTFVIEDADGTYF